jgi:hypothetical protein
VPADFRSSSILASTWRVCSRPKGRIVGDLAGEIDSVAVHHGLAHARATRKLIAICISPDGGSGEARRRQNGLSFADGECGRPLAGRSRAASIVI